MVWLLAGQTYLIMCWTVRRQTVGVATVSANPLSYRRLIILRLVALVVFSRRRLSRSTFHKALCLLTSLSDLKMIGVSTSKIIFHFSNLRRSLTR